MKRRTFSALALAPFAGATLAQPDGPLTLVVPFAPGDALDATARAVAEAASQELKSTVIVDNKPGASGFIAASAVAKTTSPTTFLLGTTAMMSITPFVKKAPYAPTDFVPVGRIATLTLVVSVSTKSPAKTWAEFVQLAKASPGKFTYASPGEGTLLHLSMEALQAAAGIKLLHVPYRGMGPALTDFLGGSIDVYAEPAVISHIKSGAARALLVVGEARLPDLPSVPTTRDLKIPFEQSGWFGVFAPKGAPAAAVERFAGALQAAIARTDLKGRVPPGASVGFLDAGRFQQQIRDEQAAYRKLITDLNIKLD